MKGRPLPSGRVGGFHGARTKMIVAHRTAQLNQLKRGHRSISRSSGLSSPPVGARLWYAFGDETEGCVHCLTMPQTVRAAAVPAGSVLMSSSTCSSSRLRARDLYVEK